MYRMYYHMRWSYTTDENALKALGIRNFDVVVAIGNDIQASILTTLVLKEIGCKKVVVKAINEMHGKVLNKLGADRVVSPERDMGVRLVHSLISPNILEYIELSDEYSIIEVIAGDFFDGKTLQELDIRARFGCNVMAIKNGTKFHITPAATDVIRKGDTLVVIGHNQDLKKLQERRMQMNRRVLITSPQNELVKRWKKLQSKKGRLKERALLIEGEHLLMEAANAKVDLKAILVNSDQLGVWQRMEAELATDAPVYELAPAVFHSLVETETPQGVAAVISMPMWPRESWLTKEGDATYLLLDAIQDPGNLGTMIRTAQAAGIDGILLGRGTVDPFNAKVVRAAMGAIFRLPLIPVDLAEAIPLLKEHGVTIIHTSPHAGTTHFDYRYPARVAFLLGNEGRGVDEQYLVYADEAINIPMPGETESLNVSITSAILLYERIRQRFRAS